MSCIIGVLIFDTSQYRLSDACAPTQRPSVLSSCISDLGPNGINLGLLKDQFSIHFGCDLKKSPRFTIFIPLGATFGSKSDITVSNCHLTIENSLFIDHLLNTTIPYWYAYLFSTKEKGGTCRPTVIRHQNIIPPGVTFICLRKLYNYLGTVIMHLGVTT